MIRYNILLAVLILFMLPFYGFPQREWKRVFFDELDAPPTFQPPIEFYDKGYLLGVDILQDGAFYKSAIVKTDIDGYVLWSKIFENQNPVLYFRRIKQNENGEIFIVGVLQYPGLYCRDPFIMKLNVCGEVEWCRVLHNPFMPLQTSLATGLVTLPDGGCAITITYFFGALEDRISLARFNNEGDMLWFKPIPRDDPDMNNEDDYDLLYVPDSGFMITGRCYYRDPFHPQPGMWPKPYFIRTDLEGNKLWELVPFHETNQSGGRATSTIIKSEGYYYAAAAHWYFDGSNGGAPALIKYNDNGELLGVYDLVSGYTQGDIKALRIVNDTLLAAGGGWGHSGAMNNYALLFDTLGNIVDTTLLVPGGYHASFIEKTHDNKLLFYTATYEQGHFDALLFKYNTQLQYDSIYNTPLVYDSLCPYPIVSDTIMLDMCELITIMVGNRPVEKEESRLPVYPNPARESFTIQVPERFYLQGDQGVYSHASKPSVRGEALLQVYDMHGRLHHSLRQNIENNRLHINTAHWPEGLYILRLLTDGAVPLSAKLMIQH
jgi:hypothetical protein